MEILEFVAKRAKYNRYIGGFFVSLYLTVILVYSRYAITTVTGEEKLNLLQIVFQILFLFNLNIWLYGARKFYEGIEKLDCFFDASVYKKACIEFKQWRKLWDIDLKRPFMSFIKVVYTILWVFICVGIMTLFIVHYHYIPVNTYGMITILLYIIVMLLNYSSYYLCIAFVFFVRAVSKQDLAYNKQVPSSTWGFQRLLYDSSMVSIAFLADSMTYVIAYFIAVYCMTKTQYYVDMALFREKVLFGYVTFFSLLPSLFSFFIVFILPKVFLDRMLKNWKLKELKNWDIRLKNYPIQENSIRYSYQLIIDRLLHDKITFGRFEIGTAVLSLLVNLSALIVNLIELIKI